MKPPPGHRILRALEPTRGFVLASVEREADGRRFVAKRVAPGADEAQGASQLRHEHAVLGRLDGTGSLLAHELVGGDDPVLLLEDFPGWPLTRLLRERGAALDLPARLRIALQLTAALGQIHACSVVHNDVCPANVLVDPESLTTKLAGFTISSLLSRERPSIAAPETIEGSLAHISPERTGRMNRLVDYRSDYYSLGATLYELFTGRVPFDTADPMALVHSHIARIPEPPHRVEPSVPPQLSAIILKLLAKMAEDRYQSTFTIESLLRACLRAAQGEGAADDAAAADGVAAAERGDVAAQLQVSQKLYGRDREVQALLDAFERTRGRPGASAPGGHVELVLVAGYSGIGKSSLVNEIHKPIAREGGYFVEGKFDQFNRNIPYASLILALQQLVRQLLTERGDALARWRERLSAAVGANGQVIAEVIPEVELIIGKQPPVRALGPAESKNRFNLTFRDFISAFASPERPLVLFLDDLQWADRASMDLLALLLCDDQIQHVLLIGAYRDNEVDATHPLTLVLDRLREAEARVSTITLEALGADDVGQLLTDTLQCSPQRAAPLVGLLMRKTGGNPFFIIQVLHQIYERDLLSFDAARGRWTWSIEDIERIDITSNVVELMVGKLRALDPATQRVLTVAACVGNRFELDLLALATALSAPEAAERLWPALLAELVVPLDEGYKAAQVSTEPLDRSIRYEFLHDRVQQAAYELVDEPERRRIHVRLGQLLLEHRTPEQIDETLFDITMHLNHGLELIESPSLRSAAVELNHRAGRRARDASAHATGLECLRAAMALLPEDHWHQDYARSLALYRDRVELEYLNIHFEHAEAFADEVLRRAASVLDKIPVYETRIQFYVSQNRMRAAIDAALEVLAMLGVTLATAPPADLPTDEELVALPEMTDPNRLAAMRILTAAMPAAYIADPALLPSIAFTMVEQLIARGNSKFSAYACAFFGLIQCGVLGDIDTGYRFGKLSLRLLETHDATELESKVYALFYIFVVHWKEHVRDAIDGLLHGVRVGLETGDIEYAGYNAIHYCTFPLFYGADLEWLGGEMARYEELSRKLDQQYQLYYIRMWRQLLLGLRTEGCDGEHLAGSCFDERTMLANLGENQTSKFTLHQAKAMLLYAFGHHRRALESLREAAVFKDAVSGFVSPVEHNLYLSLALLSVYEQLPPSEQAQALQTVDHNQAQLAGWAAHAPQNNAHKHDLVEAERARATGDPLRALGLYERAIAGARTHGYLNEEALGYERMGELLLALGHQELGLHQLQAARRLYERWGARAKCDDLTRKHPRLRETAAPIPRRATPSGPTGASSQALDLISVVKASQAVASEIVLGRLLEKMMRIIIENAGATGGALLLVRDEDASLAAVGTTTEVSVFDGSSVDPGQYTPMSLVNLVMRTRQSVVINDASQDMAFAKDPYLARAQPKSILCIPLVHGESLVGVFYMEHRMAVGAFTPTRLEVLGLLSTQVAISIENSQLYEQLEEYSHTLEAKVEARTQELQEKNLRLGDSLQRIKAMQEQIIAQEKLASLGSVTAGVAHEIRNPLNFVKNFAETSREILEDLEEELRAAQPPLRGEALAAVDELLGDLASNMGKIGTYGARIDNIVRDMLNLARGGGGTREPVPLNAVIAEYVDLAYKSACASNPERYPSPIVDYAEGLPDVRILRHDVGRVVLNLVSNAYDAIEDERQARGPDYVPELRVRTTDAGDHIEVSIRDNGTGIPPEHLGDLFTPFFTTKPAGAGTGLGLSISHEIVRKHGGTITVDSSPGAGTEFVVRLPKES